MGLNKMDLTEADYKKYLLQEYTFLKRPVFIIGNRIFMGNAPKPYWQLPKLCMLFDGFPYFHGKLPVCTLCPNSLVITILR